MDRAARSLKQIAPDAVKPELPMFLRWLLFEHDFEAERALRERGKWEPVEFVSCQGIVENRTLMGQLRELLAALQNEYQYPVDTEFTVNLSEDGDYVINLLQCRPLQVCQDPGVTAAPEDLKPENILFECRGYSMGLSRSVRLDWIVLVDPVGYYALPYQEKYRVGAAVGCVNWTLRGQGKKLLLLVPGRLGTSSPELGVPASFADISEFEAICEIADSRAGYNPEQSYGSHFFQDLVESGILYNAIFENEKTRVYAPELLAALPNRIADFDPKLAELCDIVRACDVSTLNFRLCNDMKRGRSLCFRTGLSQER